jgi:hypothetical protein
MKMKMNCGWVIALPGGLEIRGTFEMLTWAH